MIRFGILGPGKISHRFILGMKDVAGAKIIAVASRNEERAKSVAQQYQFEKYYTSYVDLLKDDEIDAVYIATPPHTHDELIRLSLSHGKHVLCEKPLMGSSEKAKQCFEFAKEKGRLLMEANKAPFTPIFKQAKQWIEEGCIGKVQYIDASYSYRQLFEEGHWVYWKNEAGGGMYDVGVYPLGFVTCLMNSPVIEEKRMALDHNGLCDGFEQILLRYKNGVIASIRGGIDVQTENKIMIYGEEGYIESMHFWKSHDIKVVKGNEVIEKHFDFNSEFTFEIQHFVDCIVAGLQESPVLSMEKSVEIIQIIEK
ncbi:Gfo/Idh/MocA family protein [Anaerorhabdus sp.]|uniref:Gfo/Idh/MocA family protein n=1 Tax=Anaerorhabdus sp. TaxID=1872524 RepID=UPI002FC8778C